MRPGDDTRASEEFDNRRKPSLGALRAQRPGAAHLRGAPARRRTDHAQGARRRVRVSRERVRQIGVCAFEKVQKAVKHRIAGDGNSAASAGALASNPLPWWEELTIDVSLWVRFTQRTTREDGVHRVADRILARRSMHGTLRHRSGAPKPRAAMESYPKFHNEVGCRSCALAAASSSALGTNRRKITHTSTSIWAIPMRSSAPIALRYSVSIRAWGAHEADPADCAYGDVD